MLEQEVVVNKKWYNRDPECLIGHYVQWLFTKIPVLSWWYIRYPVWDMYRLYHLQIWNQWHLSFFETQGRLSETHPGFRSTSKSASCKYWAASLEPEPVISAKRSNMSLSMDTSMRKCDENVSRRYWMVESLLLWWQYSEVMSYTALYRQISRRSAPLIHIPLIGVYIYQPWPGCCADWYVPICTSFIKSYLSWCNM